MNIALLKKFFIYFLYIQRFLNTTPYVISYHQRGKLFSVYKHDSFA